MPYTVVLIGESSSTFITSLQKQYSMVAVRSGKQGIEVAQRNGADTFVLDAASLGTNGIRICRALRQAFPNGHIIHIHANNDDGIVSEADIVLVMPVSARALVKSIEHLKSVQDANLLRCGTFALDVESGILMMREKEVALTPKQAALVELFLKNPNETLDRRWLMQQVWQTDYTDDTRTLSVHIRYVRKMIESNPSKPRYLKTVRGIGYRFEIPQK